jgi:diphthamide biosynthesis protein 7
VLDLHFSPSEPDLLAVAGSTGAVSLFKLKSNSSHETKSYALEPLATHQVFPESTLVLSLAWHPDSPLILGVTLSTSNVALLNLSSDKESLEVISEELNQHDGLEAWTLALSSSKSSDESTCCIYSGGDDSRLRSTLIQNLETTMSADEMTETSGARGLRGHEAGVVAILPLPLAAEAGKDILVTGSYDDHVRVYAMHDYRPDQMPRPKVLTELKIGGGVWRLKFLEDYAKSPQDPDGDVCFRVLASCMHAGARILEVKGKKSGDWTIEVLGEFSKHKSMNYGSDVQPGARQNQVLCVSTSFYDRLLCVWRWQSMES